MIPKNKKHSQVLSFNPSPENTISCDDIFTQETNDSEVKDICMDLLQPLDFRAEFDDILEPIYKSLPNCQPCECTTFYESDIKPTDQVIEEAKADFDCLSEASSALASVDDLNETEAELMVIAAKINKYREPNVMNIPFTDEYLAIKTVQSRVLSENSYSNELTTLLDENIESREANKDAWRTGIHDMVGLYVYDWEKLVKNVIGQGIYGRTSSREPFFRFQLPCNLELLKDMTPTTYLDKYCIIYERRLALYQKEFIRYRDAKVNTILGSKLFAPLNYIMVSTLTQNQFENICNIFDITEKSDLSSTTFCGICAITERLYFCKNLSNSSEESQEIEKGFIESADFKNLKFKTRHIEIPPKLKKLLFML